MGGNPSKFTLQGTNTYLIGSGSQRVLIDTGEGKTSWADLLSSVLKSENTSVSHALLTHWHHDHVHGVKDLLKLCPEAQVFKHQPDHGQRNMYDGQIFHVEGATLCAFHCPGHTSDHMVVVLQEENAMFTGDNVLGHGTAVFENLTTYLDSLSRMHGQFTGRAYPAHGIEIEDGRARIKEYISHRQQREDEILQVLKGSGRDDLKDLTRLRDVNEIMGKTPMEIVQVVYKDVPDDLHRPAEGGVKQVLEKLMREGRVVQATNKRWILA